MADDPKEGATRMCERPSYTINIADSVFQAMQGKYFLGQTKLLLFGDGGHAWGGLINPPDSQVTLFINIFTVTNYSPYPFVAQIWFNSMITGPMTISNKVTPANFALHPRPKPRVELQFAESIPVHPTGGVNPFSRIVAPRSTMVDHKSGEFILPPGGSFLIYLVPPGACLARARVAFGWWEVDEC